MKIKTFGKRSVYFYATKRIKKMNRIFLKYYFFIIVFLSSIIVLTVYFKMTLEEKILITMKSDLQKMLKVNTEAVLQWFNNQENSARLIASRPELKSIIAKVYDQDLTHKSHAIKNLNGYMKTIFNENNSSFNEYFLLKVENGVHKIKHGNSVILTKDIIKNLSELKEGETFIQLPFIHENEQHKNIEMFIATPVLNSSNKTVAILGLLLDPETSFSRIMTASMFGDSAETFAINDRFQMISESRFLKKILEKKILKNSATSNILNMTVSLPLKNERHYYPITQVSKEPYNNYIGEPVIGAWTYIPQYNFTLVSEISKEEAYEPLLFYRKVYLVVLGIILTLSISLLIIILISLSLRKKLLLNLKKIGNYQIHRRIGEGALGVVYEGKHQHLQRKTALKVLKPEVCTEESINSFKNEVRLSSQLTHPNTISIYDYGRTDNNLFYYAMEFVNGMDLSAFQKITGPIPYERAIYILIQVCNSLSEAHKMGLVHRDIKPHNIMICNQGGISDFVKVLDFGLVVNYQEKYNSEVLSGTPLFMAPETILNSGQVDNKVDIYALGVTAFYMLTGKYPIADESLSSVEVLQKQIKDKPKDLSTFLPSEYIPLKLYLLLNQCLEKDPDLRPEDMNDLSNKLKECQIDPWTEELASIWWKKHPFMLSQDTKTTNFYGATSTDQLNSTQLSIRV